MHMRDYLSGHVTDAGIATAANKVTVTGGTVAVTGWLTASNILGALGFLVALAGMIIGWYYKHRDDLRLARIRALDEEIKTLQRDLLRQTGRQPAASEGEG
jgi:hypothetical protein